MAGKAKRPNVRSRLVISSRPIVGILGGSKSDFPILEKAVAVLSELGIANELMVVSAHRTALSLHAASMGEGKWARRRA